MGKKKELRAALAQIESKLMDAQAEISRLTRANAALHREQIHLREAPYLKMRAAMKERMFGG